MPGIEEQTMAARQVHTTWRAFVLPGQTRDGDESGGRERRLSIGRQRDTPATGIYYMRPVKQMSELAADCLLGSPKGKEIAHHERTEVAGSG
jgi:hypothetical protein